MRAQFQQTKSKRWMEKVEKSNERAIEFAARRCRRLRRQFCVGIDRKIPFWGVIKMKKKKHKQNIGLKQKARTGNTANTFRNLLDLTSTTDEIFSSFLRSFVLPFIRMCWSWGEQETKEKSCWKWSATKWAIVNGIFLWCVIFAFGKLIQNCVSRRLARANAITK